MVVAFIFRCLGLADRSVWFDEAYIWRMTFLSEEEILDILRYDYNPPLHFLVLKYWVSVFGDSPIGLRPERELQGDYAESGQCRPKDGLADHPSD